MFAIGMANLQWQDDTTSSMMMLPTDMVLVKDEGFKPYVEKYAESQDVFFEDFSKAVVKLFELGVPFTAGEDERIGCTTNHTALDRIHRKGRFLDRLVNY